jgi:hypothetical protein
MPFEETAVLVSLQGLLFHLHVHLFDISDSESEMLQQNKIH